MQLRKQEEAMFIWLPGGDRAQEDGELALRELKEDSRAVFAKAMDRQSSTSWEKTNKTTLVHGLLCSVVHNSAQPHPQFYAFSMAAMRTGYNTTYTNFLLCIRSTHDSLFCMRT